MRDGREVYFDGQRVEDVSAHPALRVGVENAAFDYEFAEDPRYERIAVVREDGREYSRYFQEPRTMEDLLLRRELIESTSRLRCGLPPFAKEIGGDGLNSLTVVAAEVDGQARTGYADRVKAFRQHCQDADLSLAVAMTDVKGDRSKRPSEQEDEDLYVHLVEEKGDGMVVRGAKAHITTSPYTNEILVLPTRGMTEADARYAVAFAVPANADGVKVICRGKGIEPKSLFEYPLSSRFEFVEGLVVFDDVFVPASRIFMKGEWEHAGRLANVFATYHRFTASTYKIASAELLTGAAYLAARFNGIDRAHHIRDKLTKLVIYCETIRALTKAAAQNPTNDEASGLVMPDLVISNMAKYYFASNYHESVKSVQDIAGALVVTAPSEGDLLSKETGGLVRKYMVGRSDVPAEDRLRLIKMIRDLTASELGGFWEVTSIHAEGSLEAEKLAIFVQAEVDRYERLARIASGLE